MEKLNKFNNIINPYGLINKGDEIYVVSEVLGLLKSAKEKGTKLDLNQLIDSVYEAVGEKGTVMIPEFNWGFCHGETFDYKNTAPQTGALPKVALKRNDFRRTKHPIYSFCVKGSKSAELCEMDPEESFGPDTIFDLLYRWNAKALVIGMDPIWGLTFLHHIEKMVGVPYRYEKKFTAGYIDEAGVLAQRTYSMYVRDMERDPKPKEHFHNIAKIMQELGVIKSWACDDIPIHLVNLRQMYDVVRIDIVANDSRNIYIYKGQSVYL